MREEKIVRHFIRHKKFSPRRNAGDFLIHTFWRLATATVNFPTLHLLVLGSNGAQICTLGLLLLPYTEHSQLSRIIRKQNKKIVLTTDILESRASLPYQNTVKIHSNHVCLLEMYFVCDN